MNSARTGAIGLVWSPIDVGLENECVEQEDFMRMRMMIAALACALATVAVQPAAACPKGEHGSAACAKASCGGEKGCAKAKGSCGGEAGCTKGCAEGECKDKKGSCCGEGKGGCCGEKSKCGGDKGSCGCGKKEAKQEKHSCGGAASNEIKVAKGYKCEGDVTCCCNGGECLGDKECCKKAPCGKRAVKKAQPKPETAPTAEAKS